MDISLHFRLDTETSKLIDMLTEALACSKGELTRRALKLFNLVYQELQIGNEIILRTHPGKKERSILIA